MRIFSKNIRFLREREGLSQFYIANKLGVKVRTYEAWENDRGHPREPKNEDESDDPEGSMMLKIGKLYEVTTDDLMGKDLSKCDLKQTQEHYFITKYNLAPDNIKDAIDKLLMV